MSVAAAPPARARRLALLVLAVLAGVALVTLLTATGALADTQDPAGPVAPTDPTAPVDPSAPANPGGAGVAVSINGPNDAPSGAIVTLLAVTVLAVAPSLLLMLTSFTKIFVVLALTRNALGLTTVPPNQVLAGLALFLSIFVMGPVLGSINDVALQPFLDGDITISTAVELGSAPLREFLLAHTREEDIALMTRAAGMDNPAEAALTPMGTLVPAFMISELRAAFVIGFVVFVPFLIIDLVTSAALMSMGMMMLPPVMVSLPFKILLFVLVDGWGLIITALVTSYQAT